jgi:mannose-6-phosphate isomerase
MHLLEACLALYNAEPSSALLRRAGELTGLFEKHFTAGQGGLLGERFNHDWSMRDGADADHIEPGHQFEWVWLLHMYARTVRQSVSPAAERLYRFACTTLNSRRHAIMAVTRTGAPVDATARTWSQTEALKAHLVQFEATGEVQAARLAAEAFDVLIEDFLTAEGGWRDHLGADGTLLARNMPASTGYHVVLALSELIRIAGL